MDSSEKMTPGINKIEGTPLLPSKDIRLALKLLGEKDFLNNLGSFPKLSIEVNGFKIAREQYQQKLDRMNKIVNSAQSFRVKKLLLNRKTATIYG